ncbi:unnamed protein product [Rotaria sp. Silwood2]|nr:unnamed protein product [Rotaria sp. Silwood2]
MEVVAEAIENSQFVIICMSDSYKSDNYCQAEAEYAFNSKRFLLPLILRTGYRPDGWLASITKKGSTYIDFAGSDFKTASTWLLEEIKQRHCKKEIPVFRLTPSKQINMVNNSFVSSAIFDKPYAHAESLTVTGPIPTIESADVIKTQQAQIHSVSRTPPSDATPFTTSTIDIQQRPIHVHPISTSTTFASMVSTTCDVNSHQQQHTSTLSYPKSPTPVAHTFAMSSVVNKQCEQHQRSGHPVSKPLTSHSIVSATSVVADKQQQKHRRMTESPVSQSTITKSFSSDLPVTVEKHQQHGFTYPVSTPLTTTSAISIAIDRQQEPTQKPSFSRSSIPGYRYSTASAVVDKQQLPEAWYSASPTSIRSSSSSTVITNLDHKQQQKTTNPVLIPLTPSTVSCDTYLNVEKKQQKTPPHPKPRTSTINAVSSVACSNVIQQQQQAIAESKNDTTLPVKPITINIQQHQPIETPSVSQSATPSVSRSATPSVSRSATPGFKASDECISAIKQSQQQTLGCYISCPPARTNAVLSTTYTGVPQPQPQQLTPTHSVPQPLTNNIVSSASTTNIDKLQEKIQLRPISQSQTYNSVYSGTSVLVDQQPQLTPMQVLSPLLTNSIVSSPSHVAVNNEQQLPPRIPYVAQSRLPTSTSSGEHITAHKKPRKTVTGYFVSSSPTVTHTTLPTTSTLVTESPELTSMHLVSQPLTNKTVFSGSTTSTNNLQQKTQGHPVSHLQKSGSMSFATSAPLGQQPQLVQMHPDSQQLRNNIVSSDLPIIIDKLQQTTQVRPASQSQTSGSAPSAAYLYLDQHSQLTPMHSVPQSLRNSTASSASTTNTDKLQQKAPPRPVIQSQTTRGLPPATSVLFDQQQQLTQMHLVSHQLTNNRVSPAAPIITNKQQQKPQVPTVPQLQTPASVSSTTSFHLGQQPKLKPMPFVSQPLSNNTVSSSSSSSSSSSAINIDKQQQKTQVYPVSQSQAYDSMHSGTSTLLNPQSHLTSMHFVSQQLRNNIVSSDSPIVIDQKQQETQVDPVSQSQAYGSVYSDISGGFDQEPQLTSMYLVSQPLTNGTVSSTSIGTIGKQQQKTPCRPVSQLQTSASLSSVHHDQQPQLTPMHAISQPSTNNAVSSAPMTTIGKQPQKTQVRPVSQLQTSASVSSATYVRLNQQPKQTPMHFVPQQLRNNTASSNSSITIDELQQKTKVYPVSQSQTHASVYSGTSALLDQEPQLTPLFFVAEPSTNGSVSCGVPVTNDKRQKRPTQVPLVSQSTVADSTSSDKFMSAKKQPRREILVCSISQPRTATDAVPHTTSTVDNQPQQKTSKHVVAQSSANNTISSASTMSTKKQQQESSVPGTSRSQAPTSGVSVTPVSMKKQEGMQRHLNSRSYPHPFHELPRLPEEYTNRKTNNSRYRTVPINLWDDTDVLDFLFDSRLHAMMPLCESISGKALIRLFRMCQEKPRRLYNQLNDELRDRFNGLNLPLGVYAEFLIEMDYLVGLTPATIPEIPISRVKDEERATFRPRTVQEEPISMQRSLRPLLDITVSRSLSHSGLPAETLPGTTASNNRSFLERSFLQSPSAPGRPYMLILESIEESTLVLQ